MWELRLPVGNRRSISQSDSFIHPFLIYFHCVNLPRNCWRRIYHWPKQRNSRSCEHNMRLCSPTGWTLPLAHPGTGISWRGSENAWKNISKDTITNEAWCNIKILTLSSFRWYRYALLLSVSLQKYVTRSYTTSKIQALLLCQICIVH